MMYYNDERALPSQSPDVPGPTWMSNIVRMPFFGSGSWSYTAEARAEWGELWPYYGIADASYCPKWEEEESLKYVHDTYSPTLGKQLSYGFNVNTFFTYNDPQDGFASGKIPWWAAGISIFATLLSPISYLAGPGWVFAKDSRYPRRLGGYQASIACNLFYIPPRPKLFTTCSTAFAPSFSSSPSTSLLTWTP